MRFINAIKRQLEVNSAIDRLYRHIDSLSSPEREKALAYQRDLVIRSGPDGSKMQQAILGKLALVGSRIK